MNRTHKRKLWSFASFLSLRSFLLTIILLAMPVHAQADLSQESVTRRVAEILAHLRKMQGSDGSFSYSGNFQLGSTALALLAMLTAGVPSKDPAVLKAAAFLMGHTSGISRDLRP